MTPHALPGPELVVSLASATRVMRAGRWVVGGHPLRMCHLSDAGACVVRGWVSPAPVGDGMRRQTLARRLLDAGILEPHPLPAVPTGDLTVIVPVRDRIGQLRRCLDAIHAGGESLQVIVVDDGSTDAQAVRAATAAHSARLIRHEVPQGPSAARNSGLAEVGTPFVAFVDSDVVVPLRWTTALLGHFADPLVAAVAPRVLALTPGGGFLGGYEARHSPLDMGPADGLVAPGRRVPYVPSTVLVGRVSSLGIGFDETLRVGEDVDLVWRLARNGWRVRYEPRSYVWHDHRTRLGPFARRRRSYARSVADLSRRHPDALRAVDVSPRLTASWLLALAGCPRSAGAAFGREVFLLAGRLRPLPHARYRLAVALTAKGLGASGSGLARAIRRAWVPVLLPAAARSRFIRRLLALAYVAVLAEDAAATRRPFPVLADVPVRMLDEALAVAGTWEGCVRRRVIAPLLPTFRWRRHGC